MNGSQPAIAKHKTSVAADCGRAFALALSKIAKGPEHVPLGSWKGSGPVSVV